MATYNCGTNIDNHNHQMREHPADLLKFISWNKLAKDYDEAVQKIIEKKPVLGEPIVVPFKFYKTDVHDENNQYSEEHPNGYTQELVYGIGSTDPEHPYIHCSISHDVLNYAVIAGTDDDGQPVYTPLGKLLDNYITKDAAAAQINELIDKALSDDERISVIADKVAEKNREFIETTVNDKLTWKPLSSLIK